MAYSTFHWRGFASSQSSTTVNGIGEALVSVMNAGRSADRIRIERFDVAYASVAGTGTDAASIPHTLQKITGRLPGGDDLVVVPHDPSNPALPSQVKCEALSHVTFSAGSGVMAYRHFVGQDQANLNFNIMWRQPTYGETGALGARGTLASYRGVNAQGIVLAEGEGIALVRRDDSSLPGRVVLNMGIAMFVDDLGRSYSVQFDSFTPERSTQAVFSLFNGSGSGRTYTLTHIEHVQFADDRYNSSIIGPARVKALVTIGDRGGQLVTPIAAVPGTAIPDCLKIKRCRLGAKLDFVRNIDPALSNVVTFGGDSGTIAPFGDNKRQSGMLLCVAPIHRYNANLGTAGWQQHNNDTRYGLANNGLHTQPIILNPGRGFAIVPDYLNYGASLSGEIPNNRFAYIIELTISVTKATTPAGGAFA